MPDISTVSRRSNPFAVAAGFLTCALAAVVLAGYEAGAPRLVRVLPWFTPMRLPVAVSLFLCGASFLWLAWRWRRTGVACAVVGGLIGLELVRQSLFGPLMIGLESAITPTSARPVTLPNSAEALTGVCLVLTSVALLLMSGVVRIQRRLTAVGVLGSLVTSVGVVALLSYLAGMRTPAAAGPLMTLGVHTAFGFALLGVAMIRFAWSDSATGEAGVPSWLPALAGIAILTVSACLWEARIAEHRVQLQRTIDFDTQYLRDGLSAELESRLQPLERLARRRAVFRDMQRQDWDSDVLMILARGGYQSVQWVDSSLHAVWITPPGAGDMSPDGNSAFEARRKAAFEAARANRALAISHPVDLVAGGRGALVCVPVYDDDGLQGYVTGILRPSLLFKTMLTAGLTSRYSIAVLDGDEEVYAHNGTAPASEWARVLPLGAPGANWNLRVTPNVSLLSQAVNPVDGALLIAGCVLALVCGLVVRLSLGAARRPRPVTIEHTAVAATTAAEHGEATATAIATMPVISCAADGALQAWNDVAKDTFAGSFPPITPSGGGFRVVNVTVLRASPTGRGARPLKSLLESCALPVIAFDSDGTFTSANAAAGRVLGWTSETWGSRRVAAVPAAPDGQMHITFVLILQGQNFPSSREARAEAPDGQKRVLGLNI
jgi:PAS domain S-box-containing protein